MQAVIDAWPTLPEAVRRTVLRIIQTAERGKLAAGDATRPG
ncbi:MAG: hypothetical protein WD069_01400 [Planctomycetales bacterium]